MQEEAVRLAAAGYKLIPVYGLYKGACSCIKGVHCKSPGKHPRVGGWQAAATNNPDEVLAWDWSLPTNVGLVPGDQLVVLDFDGPEGKAVLERLLKWCPEIDLQRPPDHEEGTFAFFQTGSGGFHLLGRGKAKTAARVSGFAGFDVRGTKNGMAVIPPSTHHSGNSYIALNPLTSNLATFPQKVIDLANGKLVPEELRPPDIVTIDDIRHFSRKGRYPTAFKAVYKGEPFAEKGQRDTVLFRMLQPLAEKFPRADPNMIADLFQPSIDAMSDVDGAPSRETVVDKFERQVQYNRERAADENIIHIGVNIEEMAQQAITALSRQEPARLYRRGGKLCVVHVGENLPDGVVEPPNIEFATPSVIRAVLSSAARWVRRNADGDEVPKMPPEPVCSMLHDLGEHKDLPYLRAVVEGPFLRHDGTISLGDVYEDGILSFGARTVNTEPYHPDLACRMIDNVFRDFPFEDAHYSALFAAILTGAGRFAFKGPSPLFLIDANVRGAGKTLAASAASLIVTPGGAVGAALGSDNEEDRKQITSLAVSGAQTILIDNVTGQFGTAKLCEALTLHNGTWTDRILGSTKMWTGPFRPLWFATGNNVSLRADMARRVCWCRLESKLERPEERDKFAHPALLGYVSDNREDLYWAALSILHGFFAEGAPDQGLKGWSDYRGWSDVIRNAVVWAGYEDPLVARQSMKYVDEDQINGSILVHGMQKLCAEHEGGKMKCNEVIDKLYAFSQTAEEREEFDDLRDVLETFTTHRSNKPTAQSVGKLFKRFRNRVFDGLILHQGGFHGREWWVIEVDPVEED